MTSLIKIDIIFSEDLCDTLWVTMSYNEEGGRETYSIYCPYDSILLSSLSTTKICCAHVHTFILFIKIDILGLDLSQEYMVPLSPTTSSHVSRIHYIWLLLEQGLINAWSNQYRYYV